jgi:signal transduction histidine kinase
LAYSQLDKALVLLNNNKEEDYSKEFQKNYKYRMQTDSALKRFKNAYYWQTKFYELKKNEPVVAQTTPVPQDNVSLTSSNSITTNNLTASSADNTVSSQDEKSATNRKLWKLNYLTYGLIAALLAVLGAVLFLYNKQKSIRKKSRILELKHKKIIREREDMLEQTKHLEETNQVKDRLFSIVSHDLKDSVSSIKGCLDLLKDGSISNEEFKNLIPELSENADNASQLLYDLLNWSKTQMQNLEPEAENFDIQDVFKNKTHLIEQKIEQKRVVLIDESKPAIIHADKNMVEIVIQNLLANAIKFSRIGDVITISNRERNGNILICVEDTGVGISEENQKKLFTKEAFTTVGTDDEKGTGLGLSICKELIELNNGRIWVKSEKNLGSKFFIELPKANH